MINVDIKKGEVKLKGEVPVLLTEITRAMEGIFTSIKDKIGEEAAVKLLENTVVFATKGMDEGFKSMAEANNESVEEFMAGFDKFCEEEEAKELAHEEFMDFMSEMAKKNKHFMKALRTIEKNAKEDPGFKEFVNEIIGKAEADD